MLFDEAKMSSLVRADYLDRYFPACSYEWTKKTMGAMEVTAREYFVLVPFLVP